MAEPGPRWFENSICLRIFPFLFVLHLFVLWGDSSLFGESAVPRSRLDGSDAFLSGDN
jgi:hypothetical protein